MTKLGQQRCMLLYFEENFDLMMLQAHDRLATLHLRLGDTEQAKVLFLCLCMGTFKIHLVGNNFFCAGGIRCSEDYPEGTALTSVTTRRCGWPSFLCRVAGFRQGCREREDHHRRRETSLNN